jgi:hypothetical protein
VPDRRSVKASDLTPVLGHIEGVKRLGLLGISAISALAAACGPSFQAIYEGNSRFEHCYALEENPQTPMREKSECWRDWSEHSTYGQTRDRVQYAIARYVALSAAPNVPTDEALMNAAPGQTPPREQTITAPTPTNAFAPPPKVLGDVDAGSPTPPKSSAELPQAIPPPATPGKALPESSCADKCGSAYRTCNEPDGGADKLVRACDKTYRACMKGCFK